MYIHYRSSLRYKEKSEVKLPCGEQSAWAAVEMSDLEIKEVNIG